ncbi:MAG: heme-binding protein [Brevundimonas sp.]|uniref:GlcG/HbpS family heme-binding protein n=1 Tax=Brevundimonas sp. TaxID=1871086 RepID=UPI00271CB736|nr:heme-binding protein [Brevundimonas sp.]MDO9078772.1 heme-binding protein [Brevundimonas sp.]MDP3081286.1 heme-binding protein [Brevundimonas sp.]MDZ4060456.1 heme-binding protein [Brevundimonas sp.]
MKRLLLGLAVLALAAPAGAQTPPAPAPAAATPAPPYGAPIGLEAAQALVDRAVEAGRARGFRLAIAVVEPSGELVAFGRMDDVQYGSINVAQAKARSAARFRASSASAEERLAAGRIALLAIDGIMPVAGGVPIVVDGRVVGAIGVSGASSAQDDEVARAAIAAVLGG